MRRSSPLFCVEQKSIPFLFQIRPDSNQESTPRRDAQKRSIQNQSADLGKKAGERGWDTADPREPALDIGDSEEPLPRKG